MTTETILNRPSPYQQGQSAKNSPLGTWFDNPYPTGSREQKMWFAGWDSTNLKPRPA